MKSTPYSRREFIRLASLSLAGVGLAACTGRAATPMATTAASGVATAPPATATAESVAQAVILKIMHNWSEADPSGIPFTNILSQFQSTHDNITLEQEVFDVEDIPTKVETAFISGQEPDIIFQNLMSNSREWNDIGLTVPASPILSDLGLQSAFLDSAISEYTINDTLVAIPLQGFVWPLWYNTEILDKAGVGVPTTIDELINFADKVRGAGFNPWVVGGADTWAYIAFGLVVSSMLEWKTTERLFSQGGFRDEPAAVEGVELFVRLRDAGLFADDTPGLDNAGMVQTFVNGKSALAHLGSWSIPEVSPELGEKVTLAGFPLPGGSPLQKPLSFGSFIGKAVWVTRNGAEKMAAVEEFVRYFYDGQNIAQLVEEAALVPPLRNVPLEGRELHPVYTKQLALLNDVTLTPPIGSVVPGSVRPIVLNNVGPLAFVPGTSAEEILDALDNAYATAS
ncbi:MAG: ABC transporter substrate-binding protein [Anaerolineae bacterium]|nr:ABC transporter substrate-binding protein [Anaerolineae bacterium]RIK24291.1 MAG: hypothetical protein DCC51_00640 [Anaerolineae bacterium]